MTNLDPRWGVHRANPRLDPTKIRKGFRGNKLVLDFNNLLSHPIDWSPLVLPEDTRHIDTLEKNSNRSPVHICLLMIFAKRTHIIYNL